MLTCRLTVSMTRLKNTVLSAWKQPQCRAARKMSSAAMGRPSWNPKSSAGKGCFRMGVGVTVNQQQQDTGSCFLADPWSSGMTASEVISCG